MRVSLFRKYFRYAGLIVEEEAPEHFRLTNEIVFELRQLNYVEQWRRSFIKRWFHVRLADQSLFVFDERENKQSYGYYACPLEIVSFQSFLLDQGLEHTQRNRAEYQEQYDLVIQTANLKESFTPIRYDRDDGSYRSCVHPSAHVHIGLNNEIRVATRRSMSPIAFILFIIRQHYPKNWERLLEHADELKLSHRIRADLELIGAENWMDADEHQLYFS
ncbi:MAG: hypothetical protein DI563_20500 [Variovorax paradoxus]|uniref:DUF2290 domain-containing protein n=1 Tax=Variovorax paradoxus TaxID=34073 RepID=A0A2W5PVF8_VARPD|nr:MAG: hypothetical protein DI563_20500 [Variovorax paradoxus]